MSSIPHWTPRQRPREKRMSRTDTLRKRTRGRCGYCSVRLEKGEMTRDHIVPRCKGGETKTENLMCCCRRCNQAKGHLDLEDFRELHFGGQEFYFELCDRGLV